MSILHFASALLLLAATSLRAQSPAEPKVLEAIKSPDLSVVHLWAPWCSNCQAELRSGGWLKTVKDKDRKSTRLNSSHDQISYAVFCLKKKKERLRPGTLD